MIDIYLLCILVELFLIAGLSIHYLFVRCLSKRITRILGNIVFMKVKEKYNKYISSMDNKETPDGIDNVIRVKILNSSILNSLIDIILSSNTITLICYSMHKLKDENSEYSRTLDLISDEIFFHIVMDLK